MNIIILCFALNFRGYSAVKIQKIIHESEIVVSKMPKAHLLMLSKYGYLDDFSFGGDKKNHTLKLPETRPNSHGTFSLAPYFIFGAFHKKIIFFLTCDPDSLVTAYDPIKGTHELLPNSQIPNTHLLYAKSVQVGNFFMVFSGVYYSPNTMDYGKNAFILQ